MTLPKTAAHKSLAIIVPVYNEEAGIALFFQETASLFAKLRSEMSLDLRLIFVNDGSRDSTAAVIAANLGRFRCKSSTCRATLAKRRR